MAVIDKSRTHGHTFRQFQSTPFLVHLFHDLAPNLAPPLDLDQLDEALGLEQQIDLATFSLAANLAVGRRRGDERSRKMQLGNQQAEVVDDQVLELESDHAVPSVKPFQRAEVECPGID